MRKLKFRALLVMIASLALVAAACSSGDGDDTESPAAGPTDGGETATVCEGNDTTGDLLAQICENNVLRAATDSAYPPQSFLNEETNELEGFDIDVVTEIANRLGVDIEWEEPSWDILTAGSWNDRWDISVGSMTPTGTRAEVLDFTQAYYFTPASVAVAEGSDLTEASELSGKTVGSCGACTYEDYLNGVLEIDAPGFDFDFLITDPTVRVYDTDTTAIDDLATGRLDGVMSATPTIQEQIDGGKPIKLLGDPMFYEPLSAAFDQSGKLDNGSALAAVEAIIGDMHEDGTLTELSMKWYDEDLTKNPLL